MLNNLDKCSNNTDTTFAEATSGPMKLHQKLPVSSQALKLWEKSVLIPPCAALSRNNTDCYCTSGLSEFLDGPFTQVA